MKKEYIKPLINICRVRISRAFLTGSPKNKLSTENTTYGLSTNASSYDGEVATDGSAGMAGSKFNIWDSDDE